MCAKICPTHDSRIVCYWHTLVLPLSYLKIKLWLVANGVLVRSLCRLFQALLAMKRSALSGTERRASSRTHAAVLVWYQASDPCSDTQSIFLAGLCAQLWRILV